MIRLFIIIGVIIFITACDKNKIENTTTTNSTTTQVTTTEELISDEFYVDSFGAKPNDIEDDTTAILNAIEAANAYGPNAKVFFSKGEYIINSSYENSKYAFVSTNINNLTFIGKKTKLLVTNNELEHVFKLTSGSNISFIGVTIEYENHLSELQHEEDIINLNNDINSYLSESNERRFLVDDYGANPNDENDDADAIRLAIEDAIEYGPGAVVVFSSGQYILNSVEKSVWSPFTFYFDFPNVDGLSFEGNNTTLLAMDNFNGFFRFTNGKNLIFKGITFDYKDLPFFQGEITNINLSNGTFDVKPLVNDKETIFDDERLKEFFNIAFGTIRDTNNPNLMATGKVDFFRINDAQAISNGYRLEIQNPNLLNAPNGLNIGDKITFNNRGNNGSIFDVRNDGQGGFTYNITIEDVTIYASPHAAIVNTYNEGFLHVNNMKVIRKPDRIQWQVTNTDALFPQYVRNGVIVENSEFEGIMDDVISLHQTASSIQKIHANNKIEVSHAYRIPKVGDTVAVIDSVKGILIGEGEIIEIETVSGADANKRAILVFNNNVIDVNNSDYTADLILNRNIFQTNIIRNNIIRESRGRGIYLTGVDTLIENNHFENMAGPMIHLYKGGNANSIATNVQIINNTGENVNYLGSKSAAIRVLFEKLNSQIIPGDSIFYENVLIKDNYIKNPSGGFLLIGNVRNLEIVGNNIFESFTDGSPDNYETSSVKITNVEQVFIDGLTVFDRRYEMTSGLNFDIECQNIYIGEISLK